MSFARQSIKVWGVLCTRREKKRERIPLACLRSQSHLGCVSVKLQRSDVVVKQSSLVDTIIELCVKRLGGSIAGTFPDPTSFVLLFIQTLFMVSRSGTTLKVLFYRDIQMFLLKFLLVLWVSLYLDREVSVGLVNF